MCFDKGNQSDQYLQVTYQIFSYQICFLTDKIQKIELNFMFWQVKSNKFICIWVLTGKIQQIDLNFYFDMKIQKKYLNLCFDKGNQSDQCLQTVGNNQENNGQRYLGLQQGNRLTTQILLTVDLRNLFHNKDI